MITVNTDIKIAVAGCGSAGRQSIREFLKLDEVGVTACCDSEEEIAKFTAREFGIDEHYTDLTEMLDSGNFDALVIALPDGEHLNAAIEAFSRGINVFCENPLGFNYAEAVEMTRAARESGLVAVMNDSMQQMPVIRAVRSYVFDGRLGKVRYFEASYMQNRLDSRILDDPYEEKRLLWRLSAAAGSAGVIGELGFPLYEFAAAVCGEPVSVSSLIMNIAGFNEVEEYKELELDAGDTFMSQLEFKDGAAGVLRGSWTAGGPHEQITARIYGENGMISFDTAADEKAFTLITAGGEEKKEAEDNFDTGFYESFINAIKGDGRAVSDFDHALKIQHFIEQSKLSSEGGLKLQFDE